jgi:PAS domain S-box-containing protein
MSAHGGNYTVKNIYKSINNTLVYGKMQVRAQAGHLVIILCLLGIILYTAYGASYMNSALKSNANSYHIIMGSKNINKYVLRMDSSAKGYALYKSKVFLDIYYGTKDKLDPTFDTLFVASNPYSDDVSRLRRVRDLAESWTDEVDKLLFIIKNNKNQKQVKAILDKNAAHRKALVSEIDKETMAIEKSQMVEISNIIEKTERRRELFENTIIVGTIVSIIMSLILTNILTYNTERLLHEIEIRSKLEEDLYESLSIHSSILEASLDAIISISESGRIVEFNSAAERVFGYKSSEMIGRYMIETIIPLELRESYYKCFNHHTKDNEDKIINKRCRVSAIKSDGSSIPLEMTVVRINKKGPVSYTVFIRELEDNCNDENVNK